MNFAVARGRFPHSKNQAREKELIDYFRELPDEAQQIVVYMVGGLTTAIRR